MNTVWNVKIADDENENHGAFHDLDVVGDTILSCLYLLVMMASGVLILIICHKLNPWQWHWDSRCHRKPLERLY